MNRRILLFSLWVFSGSILFGQIEEKVGEPLYPEVASFFDIGIDASQVEMWKGIDQPKDQPYRVAIPSALSLTPDNSGITYYKNGETIWVVALSSKEAYSLNVIFEPFNLPEGAYAYVYDPDRKIVRGAFTATSAAGAGKLPVLPVPGDRMIVECHFPGKKIPSGAVGISQVSHDFVGLFGILDTKDSNYGSSESCEVDVACSTNPAHLLAARSTCRIFIDGQYLCTGSLVNNTGSELKAYLLTAYHCIGTAAEAASSIFIFNYVSPWCDGPDHRISHSISGASLLASSSRIDFTLMELSSFPPLVFEPYLAGWNITTTAAENTFVTHHPEGDIMKLSLDNDPPAISSYPDAISGYISSGFWRIATWDSGTTESGSSGSALHDQDNHIVGTLTGGDANCATPVRDYFARIDKMFTYYTVPSASLKTWLNPVSSSVTLLDGRDPYNYNMSLSDTLYNINSAGLLKSDILSSPGYGYSTGINSDSLITYAEYFDFSAKGEIAFVNLNVVKSNYISSSDTVRIFVFGGGSAPGNVLASKLVKLTEVKDNYRLKVDFDKSVPVNGPFYIGYRVYYKNIITSPQSQFALYHSATLSENSLNTAWFNNGTGWLPFTSHPSFPAPVSLAVKVIMVDNSMLNAINEFNSTEKTISVAPNPFTNCVSFFCEESASLTKLIIYDHSGLVVSYMQYERIFPGVLSVDLPVLASGIYHYVLWNDAERYSGTLIKVR